jgi:type VI secretion system secreted protein Hcp
MAAVDYLLEIDGIKGESQDHKHKETIELSSFSWGVSNVGSMAGGSGGGTNKAAFQDLHFATHVNKSSPVLALSCATGKHISKATLFVRKAGEEAQDYYKIIMEDVLVSSYQSGGSGSGAELPHDQYSFNYAKIEFNYWVQDAKGKLQGGPITFKYDLKAGKKG